MSAWAIASVAGGALALLILVLLVVVTRAAARTAANAQEILVALDEIRTRTAALADLEDVTEAAAQALSATNGGVPQGDGHSERGEHHGRESR